MVIKLFIGGKKLDLSSDENIMLNSSIADVTDITKNTTDFTKAFTVPASDNNNNIFKHYYNADIDGGFDARIKQDGRIELDGIPFKVGKWRLNSVKIKNGVPSSYNINFWGNLVSIKDALKNDELSYLDLSDYNHQYTDTNVKTGLTNGLFNKDIIYTLLAKKQYFYNSDSDDNTQTETLANIALGGGVDTGILFKDLRPSIKIIKLIEAIESKYTIANGYEQDIIFSRDFFGRTEFTNLYLWLNKDSKTLTNRVQINFDNAGNINDSQSNINLIENFYVCGFPSSVFVDITPSVGFEDVTYVVERHLNGEPWGESISNTGTKTNINFRTDVDPKEHTFFIRTEESFSFTVNFRVVSSGITYSATMSEQIFDLQIIPSEIIPKIKTLNFLKGLFNIFKLVVIPQDDGTIYVNTLKDYYANGGIINITDYVNTNDYNVSRGDILNEILFKFQEPETILNKQFKTNTGFYYGDSETFLYDDEFLSNPKLLDGESLEIELPFEQVIYERLIDINDSIQTNTQYGAIIAENLEPTSIKPHLFYNINNPIGIKKIGFIPLSGIKEDLGNYINTVSHVNTNENQSFSTVFSNEINEWDGSIISNTIYSNYWQDYILSIFNIKRRNFTYKAKNFPLRLLTELSLNDVIQIKDNYYRIDKYDINLLNGDITFQLINSFDNNINGFSPERSIIYTNYQAKRETVYVTNLTNYTYLKIDSGDGVGWCAIGNDGGNLFLDFSQNEELNTRSMTVKITNTDTLQEFDIILNQFSRGTTWDSTVITFDNNALTWDNTI